MKKRTLSLFEQYLTFWVLICMAIGVGIGYFFPIVPNILGQFEFYQVSIPTTILLWIMIYPMMLKIDFRSIKNIRKHPQGLFITWVVNWVIKPLTMYGIAKLFFFIIYNGILNKHLASEYLAGAVLLGAAPCTAMVFVWSKLTKGDSAYTLIQVATNDLIILFAYVPIVSFLLKMGNITIPWQTLFLSIILFIVCPLVLSVITRNFLVKYKGKDYLENNFIPKFDKYTMVGLLLTLIIIFSFQGEKLLAQPLSILLIAIPLIIQTLFVFAITFWAAYIAKLPYSIAAPCGMIGASNFFELAVAVAISLFGLSSGATLATVVGVLVEVPVMLFLVRVANNLQSRFS
ncbi:ACR3 family arsenite efflux transporter [Enterococcus columbae]|uniref:Arsenical-resistance protein n=1 Tax=Enterococcus columbae DSM 7374 = ATCC 51263 TaxID=1121865 RepID=S1P2Y7_9ENTE|nr:ACR3 family arsenite efflux transporter [Enterococcus columbae]EOT44660.1 arsenical-resistance protein [Enterococcus columbae DSM 7374 = ATCC 51263]EOW87444.1 arsenical-resistance protein [Enterococcus columbae DSM 7374 = ATCC 51263]